MRNIIDERPTDEPRGRVLFTRGFVRPEDLRGRDVLDIGCGFGWFEVFAMGGGAASVMGIEPVDADLATARAHAALPGVTYETGTALAVPAPDESMDTVVAWEVIEHIPSGTEPQMLAEIARVLRPGGTLYLSTPYADLRSICADPAFWLIRHRHYRLEALARLGAGAGLQREVMVVRGRWWDVLAMTNLYVSKWVLRRPPVLADAYRDRLDREWMSGRGFMNAFTRFRKPGGRPSLTPDR